MSHCPPMIREELETVFDGLLDSETGAILYKIEPSRVTYLSKWTRFLKDESAFESTQTLPPEHPRYGLGLYFNIHFHATDEGLYFYLSDSAELSDAQIIINATFRKKEVVLTHSSIQEAFRAARRLNTKKSKLINRWGEEPFKYLRISAEGNRVIVRAINRTEGMIRQLPQSEMQEIINKKVESVPQSSPNLSPDDPSPEPPREDEETT